MGIAEPIEGEEAPSAASTRRIAPHSLAGLVGPILAVAIGVWVTHPAWSMGPFAGVDVIAHVMRVTFGVERLIPHGRLDGWFPGEHLGYQLYLIRGPGMSLLTALIKAVSLNRLPTVTALNAVVISSFVAFPLAVAFLARSSGLGRTASGLAAVLSLLASNPYGNSIAGLFGLGLLENQVAAPYFPAVLGALVRIARGESLGWVLFGASALALLVLTHTPSTLTFPAIAVLYVPWFLDRRPGRALLRFALMGALAAGLASFWLIPLLAHRDLVGISVPGYGRTVMDVYVRQIMGGTLLFRPRVVWVVAAGWAFVLVRAARGRWRDLAAIAASAGYLALGYALYHAFPAPMNEAAAIRGLGYAGAIATFPLATLLAETAWPLGLLGKALALAVAGVLAILSLAPQRQLVHPYPEANPVLREAAVMLARFTPSGARFFMPPYSGPDSVGGSIPTPDRWLAWQSGRNSLSGLTLESSSTPWVGGDAQRVIAGDRPDMAADTLARLGVSHVVAPTDALGNRLAGSARFRLVWRSSPLAIFAVEPRPGQPDPSSLLWTAGPASAWLESAEPEHLRIEAWAEAPTRASVAVAWSPKWHGTLNGAPCAVGRTPDGLISIDLPGGASELALDYRRDTWDRLGLGITLATVAGMLVCWPIVRRYWCS
jgi:hypothetical protein